MLYGLLADFHPTVLQLADAVAVRWIQQLLNSSSPDEVCKTFDTFHVFFVPNFSYIIWTKNIVGDALGLWQYALMEIPIAPKRGGALVSMLNCQASCISQLNQVSFPVYHTYIHLL